MNVLIAPFINALFGLYYLVGNLGWAIVAVTVGIRLLLMPLVWPSLKSAEKMREITPKLKKLQSKYKDDKQKLAVAQMELYKQEKVNPWAGCLPQILQIAVLIVFYSAFNQVTEFAVGKLSVEAINKQLISAFQVKPDFKFDLNFLGGKLSETPAEAFATGSWMVMVLPVVLLVGSGLAQYVSARLMLPATTKGVDESAFTKATEDKEDDMMAAMRTQSLYFMPLMTIVIGWKFSVGLLLYWFVNSLVMIGQQLAVNKLVRKK